MQVLIILALLICIAGGVMTLMLTKKEDKNYGERNISFLFIIYFGLPFAVIVIVALFWSWSGLS